MCRSDSALEARSGNIASVKFEHASESPPLPLSDGVVSIRRQHPEDIDMHMAAIDEEQIRWLWEPGDGQLYAALTPDEQRAHHLRHLEGSRESFGLGPKWCFSVDLSDARYVAYVDCDLANTHVPAGDANISYACHPGYRGRGYTSRAVRLVCAFLRRDTSAREAHILVDVDNVASLRVAKAVGAVEVDRFVNEHGRTMARHIIHLEQVQPTPTGR